MNNKKMAAIAVAAVLVIAAVAVVVYYNNNGRDSGLAGETWDDILEEANGQDVVIAFYSADAECALFLNDHLIKEAAKYGISLTYTSYGPVAANTVKTEMDSGVDSNGSFDLIWGDTSPIATMVPNGEYKYMYDKKWTDLLPNTAYLTSGAEDIVKECIPGYIPGTALEFSQGQTMYVYNTAFNAYEVDVDGETIFVPYNCVVLLNTDKTVKGFLKVVPGNAGTYDGTGYIPAGDIDSSADLVTALGSATAVSIDKVREYIGPSVEGKLLYGLPNNYTDLYNWIQIYVGQFVYPDPANTAATFHSNLIFQAIIYEMEWNSAKTSWQTAADKEANIQKVKDIIASGAIKTDDDFETHFGYLYKYLEDLDEYTNKEIGYISTGVISGINGKIVGNADDDDYSEDTVMLAMTTVASIDMRDSSYQYTTGAYSMDISAKSSYYLTIPKNSSSKAGAMVVANILLEPKIQAKYFELTGNAYNIDTSKVVTGVSGTIEDEYFGFTSTWTKYVPPERLNEVTVSGIVTGLASNMIRCWTAANATWD